MGVVNDSYNAEDWLDIAISSSTAKKILSGSLKTIFRDGTYDWCEKVFSAKDKNGNYSEFRKVKGAKFHNHSGSWYIYAEIGLLVDQMRDELKEELGDRFENGRYFFRITVKNILETNIESDK